MKNLDLLRVYNILQRLKDAEKEDKPYKMKFKFFILRNLKSISSNIESLREARNSLTILESEFLKEKNDLAKKYGGSFDFSKNRINVSKDNSNLLPEITEKLNLINTSFEKKSRDLKNQWEDLLQENCGDFNFDKAHIDILPDQILLNEMEVLFELGLVVE